MDPEKENADKYKYIEAIRPARPTHLVYARVVDPQQHLDVHGKVRPDAVPCLRDEAVFLAAPGGRVRVSEGWCGVRPHPRVRHKHYERPAAVG